MSFQRANPKNKIDYKSIISLDFTSNPRAAIHGQACNLAGIPPTILEGGSLFPQKPKLGIVVLLVVIGLVVVVVVVVVVGVVTVVSGGAGWALTQHMMGRLSFISQTDFRR